LIKSHEAHRSQRAPAQEQSRLARAVYRDHMSSFARMSVVLILQLIARWA
jgi:hypothetical protein